MFDCWGLVRRVVRLARRRRRDQRRARRTTATTGSATGVVSATPASWCPATSWSHIHTPTPTSTPSSTAGRVGRSDSRLRLVVTRPGAAVRRRGPLAGRRGRSSPGTCGRPRPRRSCATTAARTCASGTTGCTSITPAGTRGWSAGGAGRARPRRAAPRRRPVARCRSTAAARCRATSRAARCTTTVATRRLDYYVPDGAPVGRRRLRGAGGRDGRGLAASAPRPRSSPCPAGPPRTGRSRCAGGTRIRPRRVDGCRVEVWEETRDLWRHRLLREDHEQPLTSFAVPTGPRSRLAAASPSSSSLMPPRGFSGSALAPFLYRPAPDDPLLVVQPAPAFGLAPDAGRGRSSRARAVDAPLAHPRRRSGSRRRRASRCTEAAAWARRRAARARARARRPRSGRLRLRDPRRAAAPGGYSLVRDGVERGGRSGVRARRGRVHCRRERVNAGMAHVSSELLDLQTARALRHLALDALHVRELRRRAASGRR